MTDAIHYVLVAIRTNLTSPTRVSQDIQHCGMWLLAALSVTQANPTAPAPCLRHRECPCTAGLTDTPQENREQINPYSNYSTYVHIW